VSQAAVVPAPAQHPTPAAYSSFSSAEGVKGRVGDIVVVFFYDCRWAEYLKYGKALYRPPRACNMSGDSCREALGGAANA